MKTLKNIFATLTLITIAAVSVNAQTSATATAIPASAKIIQPIAIKLTNDGLNFGTLVPSGTAGTVTINNLGDNRNAVDVGTILQENDFAAAKFVVTGETKYSFSLKLPETIELKSGAHTMEVNDFKATINDSNNTIDEGENPFSVGATLSVDGNQSAGIYKGQFDVTVAYE